MVDGAWIAVARLVWHLVSNPPGMVRMSIMLTLSAVSGARFRKLRAMAFSTGRIGTKCRDDEYAIREPFTPSIDERVTR
jgi:hypothetical protein